MEKLHRSQLIAEIKENFPELADPLNKEMGLLCFELNVFSRFTMQMIGKDSRDSVAKCYAIALKYYLGGNAKMRDAIDTCYVEDLEFRAHKKNGQTWAWEMLPEQLKALYCDFHGPV
ncbi:MAG: hypothetical protein AAGA76_13990 [Pseudomonadota bacterium]